MSYQLNASQSLEEITIIISDSPLGRLYTANMNQRKICHWNLCQYDPPLKALRLYDHLIHSRPLTSVWVSFLGAGSTPRARMISMMRDMDMPLATIGRRRHSRIANASRSTARDYQQMREKILSRSESRFITLSNYYNRRQNP